MGAKSGEMATVSDPALTVFSAAGASPGAGSGAAVGAADGALLAAGVSAGFWAQPAAQHIAAISSSTSSRETVFFMISSFFLVRLNLFVSYPVFRNETQYTRIIIHCQGLIHEL